MLVLLMFTQYLTAANQKRVFGESFMCKTHLSPSYDECSFVRDLSFLVMPVKKGLVAPQNIFIQTIIKKFDGSRKFIVRKYTGVSFTCIHTKLHFSTIVSCYF